MNRSYCFFSTKGSFQIANLLFYSGKKATELSPLFLRLLIPFDFFRKNDTLIPVNNFLPFPLNQIIIGPPPDHPLGQTTLRQSLQGTLIVFLHLERVLQLLSKHSFNHTTHSIS